MVAWGLKRVRLCPGAAFPCRLGVSRYLFASFSLVVFELDVVSVVFGFAKSFPLFCLKICFLFAFQRPTPHPGVLRLLRKRRRPGGQSGILLCFWDGNREQGRKRRKRRRKFWQEGSNGEGEKLAPPSPLPVSAVSASSDGFFRHRVWLHVHSLCLFQFSTVSGRQDEAPRGAARNLRGMVRGSRRGGGGGDCSG